MGQVVEGNAADRKVVFSEGADDLAGAHIPQLAGLVRGHRDQVLRVAAVDSVPDPALVLRGLSLGPRRKCSTHAPTCRRTSLLAS
ncbi:unnamed protein product [Sphagnum jensenii]|uniref:Uncharacterized protein n=2 Tax=Sphagnum jensenii TaxID=128206 RepID=A0ABP1A4N9_9BRYO